MKTKTFTLTLIQTDTYKKVVKVKAKTESEAIDKAIADISAGGGLETQSGTFANSDIDAIIKK